MIPEPPTKSERQTWQIAASWDVPVYLLSQTINTPFHPLAHRGTAE
jgi:hypothetical protein